LDLCSRYIKFLYATKFNYFFIVTVQRMEDAGNVTVALQVCKKQEKIVVGIATLSRIENCDRSSMTDGKKWVVEAYDFIDNDQLSNIDSVFVRLGNCTVYVMEEPESPASKKVHKQMLTVLQDRNIEVNSIKKSFFGKSKGDIESALTKLIGQMSQAMNAAESEHPVAYSCIGCLIDVSMLLSAGSEEPDPLGAYDLRIGSLNTYMRIDSAAASAVNLLPIPDEPKFGSIFGVLNRCRTKIGSRLLNRWVRQPLLNVDAINRRLDLVELFLNNTQVRLQLGDSALRGVPDVELLASKMSRKAASLGDAYRLYTFTKALSLIESTLVEFLAQLAHDHPDGGDGYVPRAMAELTSRFVDPLRYLNSKFTLFQNLIEHVVDFSRLPDFVINAKHDPSLADLRDEMETTVDELERIVRSANNSWWNGAGSGEIKLDKSPQFGYIMRTTKGEDERALRAANKGVRVLQILKNGCHFTTNEVNALSDRYAGLEDEYKHKQQALTVQCVETALTYMPMVEQAATVVAELDIFQSLASVAALSPAIYTRPILHPMTGAAEGDATVPKRRLHLKNARHPCVELMDGMSFIPNTYELDAESARLQLITGPNMGGKSTYIRGIGCVAVMAQLGSFIPCDEGSELSVTDCILARVGAGDAVQKGVSTFMAEMVRFGLVFLSQF
jgi:DNA mismatch repair protein MSH2